MPAKSGQYYRTEQEIAKLLQTSGLPLAFTNPFTRDYAAVKGDIAISDASLVEVIASVEALDVRVLNTESNISSLNASVSSLNTSVLNLSLQTADLDDRLIIVESDLIDVASDLNDHIAELDAHGATGNIVGTDDFCTNTVGGTVLLASALANSPTSTLSITTTPTAPGVIYAQAEALTWVATINELKTDFNALIAEYNALVAKVNDIINTQESTNQRAP